MGQRSGTRMKGTRTLRVDVGRAAAAVPAVVLLACGVAMAADSPSTKPASDVPAASAVPVVPDRRIESPGSVLPAQALPLQAPSAPAQASHTGGAPSSGVVASGAGIPARALQAYRYAETLLDVADPACNLDWELVAAIGRVESHHGSYGGNRLDAAGVARPGIVGIPLTGGGGTARITDSDGGAWDGDASYDRAVGPMQFIPGTWRIAGADAEPDGVRNPQDIDDAAAATGVYLCSGQGDLSTASDRYAAVFRYNHSDAYVRTVLAIAEGYARGVAEVPSSFLAAGGSGVGGANGAAGTSAVAPRAVMTPAPPAAAAERPGQPANEPGGQPDGQSGNDPAPSPRSTPPVVATPPPGGIAGVVGGVVGALPQPGPSTTPAPSPSPTCLDLFGQPVVCPEPLPPVLP